MARDDGQLGAAKRAYRNAAAEGNRQEQARWANVIGDILKNRGEYVEALKWLRIDYEVSVKHLPEKQLLPTCQSLGEVYLRLEYFKDALIYQLGVSKVHTAGYFPGEFPVSDSQSPVAVPQDPGLDFKEYIYKILYVATA
ncbi:hypothetical protein RJ639_012418 [Escallonia herrerae]|uniref:Uncharacterized protein n=1 Tax=Escallonia herrerae TaxID=1293975 RepID=A0AA89AMV0_9ASTE|nr:hypothetical protein RJ639_012418 [Escallonia herrerae]